MKRWQTLLIGILVSALALFLAYRQADFVEMFSAVQQARLLYVVIAIPLITLLTLVRGLRWSILTEARITPWDGFWLFNIGFLFNNILPARLGEIARASLASRRPTIHFTSALSSIVVERLFDMVCVVALFGMVLLSMDLPGWAAGAGSVMGVGAVTGLIALALAARFPEGALRLGARILAVLPRISYDQAHTFLKPFVDGLGGVAHIRTFAIGFGLSLVAWIMSGAVGWLLLLAFVPGAPIMAGMLAIAGAGLGFSVPAAPSGVGPYHAAVIGVLTAVGFNADVSRSYAFVLHASNFLMTSLLGIIGLVREGVTFREVAAQARSLREAQPATPNLTDEHPV